MNTEGRGMKSLEEMEPSGGEQLIVFSQIIPRRRTNVGGEVDNRRGRRGRRGREVER